MLGDNLGGQSLALALVTLPGSKCISQYQVTVNLFGTSIIFIY